MHTLIRKQNHKNITLDEESAGSGETVGVMTRSGKAHYVRWMGFISRFDAVRSSGKSVKLVISRVDSADLVPGQYVQGCLTDSGVYAVLDTEVAILSVDTKCV